MQHTISVSSSALGRELAIRFGRKDFDVLAEHLRRDPRIEQFAFLLCQPVKTADGTVYLASNLVLPAGQDLEEQSAGLVRPSRAFQTAAYLLAQQHDLTILSVHTHTHPGTPGFSGIDDQHGLLNARYIIDNFAPSVTHGMIVFGNDLAAHDAVIYDRSLKGYRRVDRLEVLGRPIEIRRSGEGTDTVQATEPCYDRQVRIPGWNQINLARQRMAVCGMGGDGAQFFQAVLSIGVGTEGWIAGIDPDYIEESNLPRIPYAFPEHVGQPKVTVAAQYAGRKNPGVRFYPYPCRVAENAVVDRLKEATILLGCGDNDGMRRFLTELSVRHRIPYIDLGCGILVEGKNVHAGGQVRVCLPGENGCLLCCGGYDPSTAQLDLLPPEQVGMRAAAGYVRGATGDATPSIANLNASTAQLGVAALLALVHGPEFGDWDFAHFDQLTVETTVAKSKARTTCPFCGPEGVLGQGDYQPEAPPLKPTWIARKVSA